MKNIGLILLAGGIGISLFFPAGSPALEGSYVLTADRWAQGYPLYTLLHAPVDPLFALLYRWDTSIGEIALRLWKAWGVLALGLFFRFSFPQERLMDRTWIGLGLWLGIYAQRRWDHPLEVGEPVFWSLLLLYRSSRFSFEKGILWGIAGILFPFTLWNVGWNIYRRLEDREARQLLYFLLGGGWAGLAGVALLKKLSQLAAYWDAYWSFSWTGLGEKWHWSYLASLIAFFLLLARGESYVRKAYSERRLYRDRLWLSLFSAPIAWLQGAAIWSSLLAERWPTRLLRIGTALLFVVQLTKAGWEAKEYPSCASSLPPESCIWGEPPCYLTLRGKYGCHHTSFYRWEAEWEQKDWESFYERWGDARYIFDAAGAWSEVHYHLPHLSAPYTRKDTLLQSYTVYQRR
ncbi:MAG: hypothetical protein N2170_05130 [Bacteroidia bacterium]|nr:hypothetical protein [Bacteroidia bacterium]